MNKLNNIHYNELSKAKIQDAHNLVISSTSKGGFTIAQQLEINEDGRKTSIFLKGAFIVNDIEGLVKFRDALNVAIDIASDDENW